MKFRGYRSGDLDAMFALDEVCFAEQFRFTRAQMKRYVEARGACISLCFDGDWLAGFCIVHVEQASRQSYVVTLDVDPELRRQGIAAELMLRVERAAARAGAMEMLLHVFTGNDAAICFYETKGYERLGVTKFFYGRDAAGNGMDAWLYRRVLSTQSRTRSTKS